MASSSIHQVSGAMKQQSQIICSQLQDNNEKSPQVTKSTTLFPTRIYSNTMKLSNTLIVERKQYNDNIKTDTEKKYSENELKTQKIILNQTYRQNCSFSRQTMCFICKRIIQEEHYAGHLFFGNVKCSLCNAVFRDCHSFQITTSECTHGQDICKHSFFYFKDPVQYLIRNLSSGKSNIYYDIGHAKMFIKIFVNKLKSIEQRPPWSQAIAVCRKFIGTSESLENISVNSKSVISTQSPNHVKNKKVDYHSISKANRYTEDVLLQDYDISLLEKATEFVKVPETLPENMFPSKEEKKEVGKQQEMKKQERLENAPFDEESIEFVPIPSDGFYYVSVEPLENCPNCYEVLCPSQFTVNIISFLMTALCSSCNLTIYITSAAPELKIITDDVVNQDTSGTENEKGNGKYVRKKLQRKDDRRKRKYCSNV